MSKKNQRQQRKTPNRNTNRRPAGNPKGRRRVKKRNRKFKMIFEMIITVVLIAAIGVAGFLLYKEYTKSSVEKYILSGTELLKQGDYQGAVAEFESAIEEDAKEKSDPDETEDRAPYISEAYRGLGMAYYELGDYEQARTNLQQVIDIGGNTTPALYNILGVSAMNLEDYDGALSAFEQGTALSPQETYTDAEGAEQSVDYSQVIQEMKFNRVVCFEKKLDWTSAKAEMEAYIAAYPDDAAAQKEAEFLATR